jgi:N6-L-threonylcarbamoyladenine synthase
VDYVLAIETSCDDTSVSIIDQKRKVLCCLTASQDLVHAVFGGIVPEIASRNHTEDLMPLIDQAFKKTNITWPNILGIAVTNRPGLVGSLIVGLVTAKTLALANDKPFIGVHHIEGHIMAPFLIDDEYTGPDFFNENFIALVVSGGHTQLYLVEGFGNYKTLGETIDDAAGEAFDKFAKMLGLDYPGGVQVDRLSQSGNKKSFVFPRPLMNQDNFNFSFSGLKSAAQRMLESMGADEILTSKNDLCASYQNAIVEVLISKLEKAIKTYNVKHFIISGGVSANSQLRSEAMALTKRLNVKVALPPLRYCTDNAAMIALVGLLRLQRGEISNQDLGPIPRASL